MYDRFIFTMYIQYTLIVKTHIVLYYKNAKYAHAGLSNASIQKLHVI